MARSYTSEEAARLGRTHRALLAQIDAALDSSPNYEQEIANELSTLLYSGQLADEIARDLSSGNPTGGVRPHNLPLIIAIARQKASAAPIDHLLRARDFGKTNVLPAIEIMDAAQLVRSSASSPARKSKTLPTKRSIISPPCLAATMPQRRERLSDASGQ